jgi:hypothetical protein
MGRETSSNCRKGDALEKLCQSLWLYRFRKAVSAAKPLAIELQQRGDRKSQTVDDLPDQHDPELQVPVIHFVNPLFCSVIVASRMLAVKLAIQT